MTGPWAVIPPSYVAELYAVGPVAGTWLPTTYSLGRFESISPKLVLRWLRGEALRLADRLDPDPARMDRFPPGTYRVAPPGPHCADALRDWARSEDAALHARETLRVRSPLRLTFTDQDCAYVLSVWLSTARTEDVRAPPPPAARRGPEVDTP
ncbi:MULTISPECIES: hypothetical protein [unclassified Streptomyces]|uniref:hypothetical protein n=1 Tax=unclassified Streptomyces TaxID=2593676 RepID=UPI0034500F3F